MSEWNIVNEECENVPMPNLAHQGIWKALKVVLNAIKVNDTISNYDIEMNLLIELNIRYLYSNSTMRNYLRLLTKCNIIEPHKLREQPAGEENCNNTLRKNNGYVILRHYDKTVRYNDLKQFSKNWMGWFLEPGKSLTRSNMGDVNAEIETK